MEKENVNKKDNFIYFIVTHEHMKTFKISISQDYKKADSLEKIKTYERKKELIELTSEVYRFKIIPESLPKKEDDEKYHILIFAESNFGKKYQYEIKFTDDEKDIFLYDFNIEEKNYQPLSLEEQFLIYINILRKVYEKLDKSIENENLIISTVELLNEEGKKFSFYFYLLLFIECHRTKYIHKLLLKFNPENIDILGDFEEEKLTVMKTRLNLISTAINESLNLNNVENENELKELFYTILLYFNMNFQQDKIHELLGDDNILDYLSKKLLIFRHVFKEVLLHKDTIRKLIKKSKSFNDILIYISYNGNYICDFLDLIFLEFDYICEIYKSEQEKLRDEGKEMKYIDIEKYVETQKSDDISKLKEVLVLIFSKENDKKVKIIKFSENIIKNYVEYFIGQDYETLNLINELVNEIKKNNKNFEFIYEGKSLDLIIHDTGIEAIERGEMNNNEILDFIKNDKFFNVEIYKKVQYRPVTILSKINIEAIDEQFFKIWNTIKFNEVFSESIDNFYKAIADLIKNIKDFGLLYKLFINNDTNKYENEALSNMKNKYINLLKTLEKEKCPNFVKDTINLIILLDEIKSKERDTRELLECIQKNFDFEQVKEIYLKLSEENKNLSKKTKDIIITYLIDDKNISSPLNLVDLIKNFKNLRKEIFNKIAKYTLKEEDFLSFEETENFKFFKGIIDEKIIKQDLEYKDSRYIRKIENTINTLNSKIKNFEIKYNDIIPFFESEENKNSLKGKIFYLNFLDKDKTEKDITDLENKVKEVMNKINDFDLIIEDFRHFFYQKHINDINNLTKIYETLKSSDLNCFEKNYKADYEKITAYLNEAKKRRKLKESIFFNEILKYNQKILFKNDEEKALKEAENSFEKLKIIFEPNGLIKMDKNLMRLCLKPFKKDKQKIMDELKTLGKIFNSKADMENIYEGILLFLKRKFILNAASSILVFINTIEPNKTNFIKDIEKIIKQMKENNDIQTIKECNEKLIELNVIKKNENEGENKLINILLKFREQQDSILFLLKLSNQDLANLQEIASSNDNNYNIVTIIDILDMEKCIDFFREIGTLDDLKKMKDCDIIEKMNKKVQDKKDINVYFEKYVDNYGQIQLLKTSVNMSEFIKYIIEKLFKGSEFLLSNKKGEFFKCNYEIKENRYKSTYSREDIISFRDRALLSKTITSEYNYFIESISEIINISNILKEIYNKGYPKIIIIKIIYYVEIKKEEKNTKIEPKLNYFIDGEKKENFEKIKEELTQILSKLKKEQLDGYKKEPLIRYIYGRQFNLLYDIVDGKNNNYIDSLLRYITNDSNKNIVKDFKVTNKGDIIQNNIKDWNEYLKQVLNKNNLKLEDIYKPTLIKKNIKISTGVLTYVCEELEKNLYQIYKYLTGNEPIAQNILLINKMTTNEEITAFLYRAILCKFNSCFFIAGLESLDSEKKGTILDLLNYFFQKEDKKIKSYLILLFDNNNSDIYKSLSMKRYRNILNLDKKKFEKITYKSNDIQIIKSDKSGVGKSKIIESDIEKAGKKRIYFPFGETFSQENLISRFKKLEINDNCVLHLDLNDSDKPNLMMEVLFSILITRFYGQNEDIFYLPKNIPVKIEIPNTFINFFEKFPLLNLFEIKEITIKNLEPLIIPENKDVPEDIEIVYNYLSYLEENKIDFYDLILPGITPDYFKNREITEDLNHKHTQRTTSLKMKKLLSSEECKNLIMKKLNIEEPNYYQIKSFINVLAVQLKRLNRNAYLNAFNLIDNYQRKLCPVRTFIVNSFIKLTSHFTKGAYTKLLQSQDELGKKEFGIYEEKKDLEKAINKLAKDVEDVVSYDKIDPSLVFFHENTSELFSIITNKAKDDEEYKELLNLMNSQSFFRLEKIKELPNYRNYTQEQFLTELKNILDIKNPVKPDKSNERKSLEEIAGDYVITADNFVKMILILIRIRSNIPVIMMGETGCGKTSLIRKLSEMKNEGEQKLKILNIHAGTNDEDIIKFINNDVIPEANKIKEEKEKKDKEKQKEENQFFFEEPKLWVFFDEINTCKCMGLISELMCKHSCQGSTLPNNIVFIGACNPYRIREEKKGVKNEKIGLEVNQAHNQKKELNQNELKEIEYKKSTNLVYKVNPLPHSLLNFVFYFGKLKPEDEKNYIKCIIKQVIEKIYYNNNPPANIENEDEKIRNLKQMAYELIWEAQEYIRTNNDESAVSLREIRRVNLFYEFFYNYLNTKINYYTKEEQILLDEDSGFYKQLDNYSMQVYSLNLSIFICYYLRITNKEQRKELEGKMNSILKKYDCFKLNSFLDLPLQEEKFIVKNIKLDKGIAENRALLENIFSLFAAINSKIPIFIVGKPGCSKSLSVQLITKSMQGNVSDNPFFKLLPKPIIHSYQGSLSSTSKGIQNVFIKARDTLKQVKENRNAENIISLIYFDEMGLAEHSPNNPLKVIHSELEYDQNANDKQVAFVGISNWELDAAKMNRGISISIPEPDEEDNKETAFIIGNSYDEKMALTYRSFFENLGKSYFNYKQILRANYSFNGKDDFHGNRDFYHLVKNSARNMIEKEKNKSLNGQTLIECAVDSIERNFSGIQFDQNKKNSLEIYKRIFHEIYPACQIKKEYDILKRIKENLKDINSRYLLIASESSIGTYLLSYILEGDNKEYNFYIGSPFEQDLHSEEYTLKVMNKIQVHMERDNILILKNLETVYPSMYDLFNQNFTVKSDKNYARLAVGSNINTFAYVNKEFRCIVNVETSKLDQEEAPFLNRFEKHIMSFEYMMNEELIREAEKIRINIDGFFKYDKEKYKAINYDLTKLKINCGNEEIQALVYIANKKGIKKEDINDFVLEKIAMTLPQDILLNLKIAGTKQAENLKKILKLYKKGEHSNFNKFLAKANQKNIVYTFSNYLEDIFDEKCIIKNELVGEIKKENIKYIQLNSIKSEREFENYIKDYLTKEKLKVCIIKFLPYECSYMNYIKFFIENAISGNKKYDEKIFIFVVYMSRISLEESEKIDDKTLIEQKEFNKKILTETLSNLSDYYQIFIDNLNGDPKLKIENILLLNNKKLFENLVNPEEQFTNNIYKIISYIRYNVLNSYKGISNDNYVDKLIELLSNTKRLRYLINESIFKQLLKDDEEKDKAIPDDIITKIYEDKDLISGKEMDIITIIKDYLIEKYISRLSSLFFKAEKNQFFSSLLTNSLEEKIWSKKVDKNEIKNENEIEEEINKENDEKINDNTLTEKLAKLYLENLEYYNESAKLSPKLGSNKVAIILGLKIPGIKSVLDNIINDVKDNILEGFSNNEDLLRKPIEDDTIEEEKNNYFNKLLELNYSLYNLIAKKEELKNIFSLVQKKNDEEKKLYELLLNDYYYYFLANNISKNHDNKEEENNYLLKIDSFDNSIKYFNIILDIKNNTLEQFVDKNKILKNYLFKFAEIINWIQFYQNELSSLQKIYLKLSTKIPELLEQIEQVISSKQIQFEISDRNPEYTRIVNEVFFISLDSILRIITSKIEIYNFDNADEFIDLIKIIKDVLQHALRLNNGLTLRSKEVFSLKQILKLVDALDKNNMANKENMNIIIQFFNNEANYLKKNVIKNLCSNLEDFCNVLEKMMGNLRKNNNFDFYKFLSIILLDEFNKLDLPEFRQTILNKMLIKNELIKNSSQIIKLIIENSEVDSDLNSMIKNINSIKEENSPMFTILNNTKNAFLEEVIMNIFERKIIKYYELIEDNINRTNIIFDKSFDMFKEAIDILNSISQSKNKNNEENMNLVKLYSIVYVKLYLYHLTNFIVNNFEQMKDIKEIINHINNLSNKAFSKVIKIYILKLIFNLKNNDFEEFKKFEFDKHGLKFYEEFKEGNKNNSLLTFFFLPSEPTEYKNYQEILNAYIKDTHFNNNKKEIEDLLDKYGLDLFLIMVLNKIVSNIPLSNYESSDAFKNLSKFAKDIFNDKNPRFTNISKILFLFFNFDTYINKMKPKIKNSNENIDIQTFEALLYGFRFCVNSLYQAKDENPIKKNSLYSSFFTKDCQKVIGNVLIPGNDDKVYLHLITLKHVQNHFAEYKSNYGCYVCSCGYYYCLLPCGFPYEGHTFKCLECQELCGWGPRKVKGGHPKHGMQIRKGYYRIFKNKKEKDAEFGRYGDLEENYPNLLYDDYIKEIIEPKRKNCGFGFNDIDRFNFEDQQKNVRNLSNIGYRLLNFISYSHLFYSYCLGNIPQKDFENCLVKNCDILKIIKMDWDLLKEALQNKGANIQIFINIIFKDLSKLLKEFEITEEIKDREKFENEVEKLISKTLEKYPEYSKKYTEENQKLSDLDIKSLKTYMTELIHPSSESYSENEYPMFKYFNYTKYKSVEDMAKKMNDDNKYQLIKQFIVNNPENKNLSCILPFNEFSNYMLNRFSFKISRDYARETSLEETGLFKTRNFEEKFNNFIKVWKNIYKKSRQYLCRNTMDEKEKLEKTDKLINFLVDGGEFQNGMYLAAAYQYLIGLQKEFLNPILEANLFSGILNSYVNSLSKTVPIQEAKKEQIVLIEERFKNYKKYSDFNDVVYAYSERNIFGENGKVNYSDYNTFVYDFDNIEEELGKIILPGVCFFESENKLNFVVYWGESFRGGNSGVLTKLLSKYKQINLEIKEKQIIYDYITKMNDSEKRNKNKNYDFGNFFTSMQMLIFYLTERGVMKEEETIDKVIKNAPSYLKLSDDCVNFFRNEGKNFTLNKVMDVFSFFEHLNFDVLAETLHAEYRQLIPEDTKKEIIEKLIKNPAPNDKISIKDLGAATRRLISRYLAGKMQVTDIPENSELESGLGRGDLWDENVRKLGNFENLVNEKLKEFKLIVGQAYEFYKIIGYEDKNSLNFKEENEIIM